MKLEVFLTFEDKPYVGMFSILLAGHSHNIHFTLPFTIPSTLVDCDAIVTTNPALIKQLTGKNKCAIDDYAGSLWLREDVKGKQKAILAILPLKRLVSTKPGKFLCKRFLSKILNPQKWPTVPSFNWELSDDLIGYNQAFDYLRSCDVIACDIETSPAYESWEEKTNPRHLITCVGYCGVIFSPDGNEFTTKSFVIPLKTLEALRWVRKINSLTIPKIFQNGKYDNFYFLRFNAPVASWYFDTLEAHHAFLSELPKNLGYISAFYIRDIIYWKDEAATGNLEDFYRYNAKDCWATACVFLTWLKEAPSWAIKNYLIKFPLIFPCLATEVDGLLIDQQTLTKQKTEQNAKLSTNLLKLQNKLLMPSFNPSSPKQVLSLLHLFGQKDLVDSSEKTLEKFGDRHPIFRVFVDEILAFREAKKLISTYLEATLHNGKLFYTLNPSGTDTGRLASREGALWCGTQLQNLPPYYKQCIIAEEGFFLGEGDNEKSETHCVANLSGDRNLLTAVSSEKDFHCINASNFFGIPYEQVLEEASRLKKENRETESKRHLAKRVGHGANYNMGPAVLLATMGTKLVIQAGKTLGLKEKRPIKIAEHLLLAYEKAYPLVKTDWYNSIKAEVAMKKMLTSQLGWTRFCFGNPAASKPDLNAYVAHVPSNLSVAIINEAFVEIFYKLHMRTNGAFRLKGQIHDSILFAYKEGRVDLAMEAAKIMDRPKLITDCKGEKRIMRIPVALKGEARRWSELKKISLTL